MATVAAIDQSVDPARVEDLTREIGRSILTRLGNRRPSVLEARWYEEHLLEWVMSDESVKVQMFRFVDVLPMLKGHDEVARHLREYFQEVSTHLPWLLNRGINVSTSNSILSRAVAYSARRNVSRMADRFIAGANAKQVLPKIAALWDRGQAFSLDLLGEAVITAAEADAYQQKYIDLLDELAEPVTYWPNQVRLDCGRSPRLNVSLKLSALTPHFRPIDPAGTAADVLPRLRPILERARDVGAYVHFDMEHRDYKDLTLHLVETVLSEPDFADWADTGIVLQAYLRDSESDFERLLRFSEKRGTPMWVRLVKGAYWDYETIVSGLRNWPVPVFERKPESDIQFERLAARLMKEHETLHPAIASHNMRSIAAALAWARELNVPSEFYELQTLYGMGEDQARVLTSMGQRVRVYTPFGDLIPGMAYLVRRLLENTSNESFLRHSYAAEVSVEELLMSPAEALDAMPPSESKDTLEFQNEPLTDFTIAENREAMEAALADVRDRFGEDYPLVIDGKAVDGRSVLNSRNPSNTSEVLGTVASASADQAGDAVEAAQRAQPQWAKLETEQRAEYLEVVAAELNARRFELAAWIVFEVGKPWADADADVAEAIDFCRYYAMQARELDEPVEVNLPGEENATFYNPRGVVAVIAPWNFPLAILTGMTTAALATGNAVIMKPAEQSSIVAAQLMSCFRDAGIPDGVVNFLPGDGETVGPALVSNPDVDVVAFTGSREVGLMINEAGAARDAQGASIKRIIAEMGGKNAIIIDSDADLDEAVVGVIESAFGYAGQKCSACSRVIVLNSVKEQFVERLTGALDALPIGPAEEPGTVCGPLIDEVAVKRVKNAVKLASEELEVLAKVSVTALAKVGNFVPPTVFDNVPLDDPIAQTELFAPVITLHSVRTFDEAITAANSTDFALTGGVYSRSPKNLRKARREFRVGNLYLNRPITGALVGRQPFGGFRFSGIGSKAGGPDYLKQFVVPTTVTENTMRRGFSPPDETASTKEDA